MFRCARPELFIIVLGIGACETAKRGPSPAVAPLTDDHASPLHNVLRADDDLISGSMPEGDAGFDALKAMGVRTIVSVDGATPDVARARARGMRYVHVPVGYDGIDAAQARTLARAVRDLPGPVYVHCHHGKHRGPAACAVIAIALDRMEPEAGEAFLRRAGTSPDYPGLFASVAAARPLGKTELDAVAPEFPEVAPRPAFVEAMSLAQDALDHLMEIRDAGWTAPPTHPDLVPAAEAARLESLLRGLIDDVETGRRPADFREMMFASRAAAAALEEALSAGASADELSGRLGRVASSCRDCHVPYRNTRK